MYTNYFKTAPLVLRTTSDGTYVGTAVANDIGNHDKVLLYVGVASAHPHYSDRGPNLTINLWSAITNPGQFGGIGAISTTLPVMNLGEEPSTAKSFVFDITNYALGWVAVEPLLSEGISGATAQATFEITIIAKGRA